MVGYSGERKRKRRKKGSSVRIPGGSSRSPGGSVNFPGGSMSIPGGSVTIPAGRLKPKHRRHRSVPASQGRLKPVFKKGGRYKHGAHFMGGSLSAHDGHRVFHGATNSFYPAVDRDNLRHINYRGMKHASVRGTTI